MRSRLEAMGLPFDFVDAVDGRNGLPTEFESLVDREAASRRRRVVQSEAEFACALSHALLYERILREGWEQAIVLEDDMVPAPDFPEFVKSDRLKSTGKDLMLLYHTNGVGLKGTFRSIGPRQRFLFAAQPGSTAAYWITRRGAEILHRAALPISYVADWPLLIPFRMKSAGVYPVLFHQSLAESQISTNQDARTLERSAGLIDFRNIRAFLSSLYHRLLVPFFTVRVSGTDQENVL